MKRIVYALPGNAELTAALLRVLDAAPGEIQVRRFPDGETYVRLITPPADGDVIFACGLQNPDEKIAALDFAVATARELGAKRVGLVAPYLSYMRQDARFHDGEALTSSLFAAHLSSLVDWLATVDPHLHRHASLSQIYSIPTMTVSSTASVARWIRSNVRTPLLIGPDAESAQWVAAVASTVQCPHVILEKTRRGDRDVVVSPTSVTPPAQSTAVILDDIISTGQTMAAAVAAIGEMALPAPVCIGVHAIFCHGAEDVLSKANIARTVTCNTIPHPTNRIDVLEDLARTVAKYLG